MLHWVTPLEPGRTLVRCEWYFDPAEMAKPDFNPSDAIEFWDLTNRQDWHVCELQQQGTKSRAYTAGRYSSMESSVHGFDLMVADRYANDGIVTPQGSGLQAGEQRPSRAGQARARATPRPMRVSGDGSARGRQSAGSTPDHLRPRHPQSLPVISKMS